MYAICIYLCSRSSVLNMAVTWCCSTDHIPDDTATASQVYRVFGASSVNGANVAVVSACKESLTLDLCPWPIEEPGTGAHKTRHRKVANSSPGEKLQMAVALEDEIFTSDNLISRATNVVC